MGACHPPCDRCRAHFPLDLDDGRDPRISPLSPRLLGSTALMSLVVVLAAGVRADVVTDGSLGPRVARPGLECHDRAGARQIRGGNLFHSFERFNVENGGSVTFTGPSGLKNVISRVTGGERSRIDGTLASTVPNADFYFINPAGIMFGPNARIDVPASFRASTADRSTSPTAPCSARSMPWAAP